jgi:hypothetical protein
LLIQFFFKFSKTPRAFALFTVGNEKISGFHYIIISFFYIFARARAIILTRKEKEEKDNYVSHETFDLTF